ncbi:MAG TPA: PHP domain-containing protein [Jatrophihabitans sp.]
MIDLHTHTTASDGTDQPAELVTNAVAAGLRTLGITDHDTTRGWDDAIAAVSALDTPFSLIRGTEFSCVYHNADGRRIPLHLLGYLFDPEAEPLRSERAALRQSRLGRGEAIVTNLAQAGFPITWQRVMELADGGSVGRPHIGRALVEAGVVADVDAAFAELLSSSSPYYVRKQDMPAVDAVRLIRQAGGVPVIAHPWARRRGRIVDENALATLVEAGMLGIEIDHIDHAAADRVRLRELAAELGVFGTGSSDYHGTNKLVRLGTETTSPESLERLVAAGKGIPPVHSPVR